MSVRGQVVVCRASSNCDGQPGDDLGVAVDGEGCCLGNPDALAYTAPGSEECTACVGEFCRMPDPLGLVTVFILLLSCWIH